MRILAGKVPFDAELTWSVIYKHIHEAPPPIPDLQPGIQKIIDCALAKNPEERYQTCREMARDYMSAIGFIAEAPTLQFTPIGTDQAKPTAAPTSKQGIQLPASARGEASFLSSFVLALATYGVSRLFSPTRISEIPTPTQYTMTDMVMPGEVYDFNSDSRGRNSSTNWRAPLPGWDSTRRSSYAKHIWDAAATRRESI